MHRGCGGARAGGRSPNPAAPCPLPGATGLVMLRSGRSERLAGYFISNTKCHRQELPCSQGASPHTHPTAWAQGLVGSHWSITGSQEGFPPPAAASSSAASWCSRRWYLPQLPGSCFSLTKSRSLHRPAPARTAAELPPGSPTRAEGPACVLGDPEPCFSPIQHRSGEGGAGAGPWLIAAPLPRLSLGRKGGSAGSLHPRRSNRTPVPPFSGHGEMLLYPAQCSCWDAKFPAHTNSPFVHTAG